MVNTILNSKINKIGLEESRNNILKLFDLIKNESNRSVFLNNLMIDLFNDDKQHGIIARSYRKKKFNKKGKNILYSLLRFHMLEQCGNFRDMSIQLYGNEYFRKFRQIGNQIFMNIPIPQRKTKKHIYDYDDYDTNKEPFINSNIELLTMNQNSMLSENIKNQQSEMMEQIRIIKEEIRLKEAELRKQEKTNLDHYNSIEKLKIQVEGFNKQLNLQKELITQTENSLNAKLEQIKHANDKLIAEFITKSISNKYLFKSNSIIIFWFNIIPTESF